MVMTVYLLLLEQAIKATLVCLVLQGLQAHLVQQVHLVRQEVQALLVLLEAQEVQVVLVHLARLVLQVLRGWWRRGTPLLPVVSAPQLIDKCDVRQG